MEFLSILPPSLESKRDTLPRGQYWDIGKCQQHTVKVDLPPEIAALPAGTDLLVTFSTGSVATMAHNWFKALRRAGVADSVLIGVLPHKVPILHHLLPFPASYCCLPLAGCHCLLVSICSLLTAGHPLLTTNYSLPVYY